MQTFESDKREETTKTNGDVELLHRACPACGTDQHRGKARFCIACGRELEDLSYLPAAALQASYSLKRHRQAATNRGKTTKRRPNLSKSSSPNRNGASSTAMAFVTYALVPYLGILFCPGAVLMGSIGLIRQWRVPKMGGRNASYAGLGFGLVIFGVQVFLWWILYKIPKWAMGVEF